MYGYMIEIHITRVRIFGQLCNFGKVQWLKISVKYKHNISMSTLALHFSDGHHDSDLGVRKISVQGRTLS